MRETLRSGTRSDNKRTGVGGGLTEERNYKQLRYLYYESEAVHRAYGMHDGMA
jgi:hypothetical protein